MKVFINPGHAPNGNPDPGACGHGLRESDVVAEVGYMVEQYLKEAGCEVMRLQSDSLHEISSTANDWDADIFVSIHCNSSNSGTAEGTETFSYYNSAGGHLLAKCINDQIVGRLPITDRGVKEANYHVLRETNMPAVLVELAFINNYHDSELLKHRVDDFARAIACGVTDYQLL